MRTRRGKSLSYIKGPRVDDWVVQEAQKVVTHVYGRPHDIPPVQATHQADDEVLWNDFINRLYRRIRGYRIRGTSIRQPDETRHEGRRS